MPRGFVTVMLKLKELETRESSLTREQLTTRRLLQNPTAWQLTKIAIVAYPAHKPKQLPNAQGQVLFVRITS